MFRKALSNLNSIKNPIAQAAPSLSERTASLTPLKEQATQSPSPSLFKSASLPWAEIPENKLASPLEPMDLDENDLIVLADPDTDRRNALKFLLEWAGYRVLETGHLAECLAWVHRMPSRVQAVITAESVGKGKALAARVLALNPALPVMEFTEDELDTTVDCLIRPNSNTLTVPPLRQGTFLELLQKALESRYDWKGCSSNEWGIEAVA
jgi:hypothetical protein